MVGYSQELSSDASTKFYYDVNKRIFELCHSADVYDRLGGISALDNLIDYDGEENTTKVTRFANYLRLVLPSTDTQTMIMAAKAMGHLALLSGTLTGDFVDFEIKRALEYLQGDRQEMRRHAAVLAIKELANSTPTLIYGYIPQILESLWAALRDTKVTIRESGAEAMGVCLEILYAREASLRNSHYIKVLDEAQNSVRSNATESIHGGLLVYRELLLKGGMFMHERYRSVCDITLKFKDHRDFVIRKIATQMIATLAAYNPTDFVASYLHKFMLHLLSQLQREKDRSVAFLSIGGVAVAVGSSMGPYLENILQNIREGLAMKGKVRSTQEEPIFQCISMLATAVGQVLLKHVHELLDLLFNCGLSEHLRKALDDLANYIPPLLPTIQERLLNMLSIILSGHSFTAPGSPHRKTLTNGVRELREAQVLESRDPETKKLALETLGSFDFSGHVLNEFVRDCVVLYLDDNSAEVRKAAAITCCSLFVKDPICFQTSNHAIQVVAEVLEKLLIVGITDSDPSIREIVLLSLDPRFDRHLAQAENLRSLFIALNDEVFSIREIAISIIGRLTYYNPAYVMPSLRKTLIQLLTEIEYSTVSRNKEEAARLLTLLVANAKVLIRPYVEPIIKVLLSKAHDSNPGVAATVLGCIGELANVGGEDLLPYIPELLPLILDTLQDQSSLTKRDTALKTLGQISSNSGYVIAPYLDYPQLLDILINILKSEQAITTRRETVKVIGILGAVDPHKQQMVERKDQEVSLTDQKLTGTDVTLLMRGIGPSSEEYFPTIVIEALLSILRDSSLGTHHTAVVQAIMYIFKTLGLKCVTFLPQIIPGFLLVMHNCPVSILEFYFQQLDILVSIVKQHIRNFLPDILKLVKEFWNPSAAIQSTILGLVESVSLGLEGEFKAYLPEILPILLNTLDSDITPNRAPSKRTLEAFVVFGSSIEEYMHLILPPLVKLFERTDAPISLRKAAMHTISQLSKRVNFSDTASRIVHPITRVLSSANQELRNAAMDTLCALIFHLGFEYTIFVPMVNKCLVRHRIVHPNYELLVSKLLKGESLPQDLNPERKNGPVRSEDPNLADTAQKKLPVNQQHLKSAWEASQRSTRDDWQDWIRRLNIELLKESPSHALRACASLASLYQPLARELFNAAFVSCWTELYDQYQDELVRAIESALISANTPPDILQTLLNLAEFMEHDDKALPIDIRTLGAYAGKCHAFAKALHYKELEFLSEPSSNTIEALIGINNQLQQPDAAVGILSHAQQHHELELKESWYEKLGRWEDALQAYEKRTGEDKDSLETFIGKLKCYHALGEWDLLSQLAQEKWLRTDQQNRRSIAPLAAAAAWGLGQWESMDDYITYMRIESPDQAFFRAIVSLHRNQFEEAGTYITKARDLLDRELTALVGESYNRAYRWVTFAKAK